QGAAFFRELVLDANGALRYDAARDELLGLERAQTFRQHPIGDVRDGALDHGIARLALEESLDDSTSPPAADELDGAVKAGTDLVRRFGAIHEGTLGNPSA